MSELVFVNTNIRSISPTRLIPLEEVGLTSSDAPETLKQFLREDCFDRERLKPFDKLRKRFETKLLAVATRGPLGWGVSVDDAAEVAESAKACQKEYREVRTRLVADLDSIEQKVIDEARRKFAGYSWVDRLVDAIRQHMPTARYIERHVDFEYYVSRVSGVIAEDDLARAQQRYAGNLVDEVANRVAEVRKTITECANAERGVAPQTLEKFSGVNSKVKKLAFINGGLRTLSRSLDDLDQRFVRPRVKQQQRVPVSELGELLTALNVLAEPDVVKQRLEEGSPLFWSAEAGKPKQGRQIRIRKRAAA